MTSSAAILG